MPLGPGSRLDAYELVAPLGTGGMGEVWLATETRLGRKVGPLRAVDGTRFDRTAATASSFKYLAPDESAEEGW